MEKGKRQIKSDVTVNDTMDMKRALKFLAIVLGVCAITLLLSSIISNSKKNNIDTEIQYEKILVGEILTRNETEYYVLALTSQDEKYNNYSDFLQYYEKEDEMMIYSVDLDSIFNKNSMGEEFKITGNDVSTYKFKSSALLKIKEGSLVKSFTGDKILEELKLLNK